MHEKPSLTFHLKFKLCIAYYPLSSEACHDQGPQQSPSIRSKARTHQGDYCHSSASSYSKRFHVPRIPWNWALEKKIKSIHSSDRRWVI